MTVYVEFMESSKKTPKWIRFLEFILNKKLMHVYIRTKDNEIYSINFKNKLVMKDPYFRFKPKLRYEVKGSKEKLERFIRIYDNDLKLKYWSLFHGYLLSKGFPLKKTVITPRNCVEFIDCYLFYEDSGVCFCNVLTPDDLKNKIESKSSTKKIDVKYL